MLELKRPYEGSRFWIPILLSIIAYILLSYFVARENTTQVFISFAVLFSSYFILIKQKINWLTAILFGLLFRLITLFSFPSLSDDIYRFIWDGNLIMNNINPYLFLPSELNDQLESGFMNSLFTNMNSPDYYTVYPPVCQFIFSAGSALGHGDLYLSSLFIKTFVFLAECGSLLILVKLLEMKSLDKNLVAWYALNPLIIVELCGNAHFEGIMIFYLLLGFYFMEKRNFIIAGVALGLAVSVKLLPLLIIPFLPRYIGLKNTLITASLIICIPILLFIPFADAAIIPQFLSSLDLYFRSFEFNASIYNLSKTIYTHFAGYNRIDIIGPILALTSSILILILALSRSGSRDIYFKLMIGLSIYFFFSTTVHPWYLATICCLAPFTKFRYIYAWSALAILSYATYGNPDYTENTFLLILQYGFVFSMLAYELITFSKTEKEFST